MSLPIYFSKTIKHPTIKGLEVTLDAMEEHISPNDSFSYEEDIKHVIQEFNNGNEAAWFCARVTVSVPGLGIIGTDYLGGCSYASFEEFMEEEGYFSDMIDVATKALLDDLRTSQEVINSILKEV
jgi:hypothetical protein